MADPFTPALAAQHPVAELPAPEPAMVDADPVQLLGQRLAAFLPPEAWQPLQPLVRSQLRDTAGAAQLDYLAGCLLGDLDRAEDAIALLTAAVRSNPTSTAYQSELIRTLLVTQQPGAAYRAAWEFCCACPASCDARQYLVAACAADLAWVDADDGAEIAAQLADAYEDYPELHLVIDRRRFSDRIAVLLGLEDLPRGAHLLAIAVIVDPHNKPIFNQLALVFAALGKLDEAVGCLRRGPPLLAPQRAALLAILDDVSTASSSQPAIAVLRALVSAAPFEQTLAYQRIGTSLARLVYRDAPDLLATDPLPTAFAVWRFGQIVAGATAPRAAQPAAATPDSGRCTLVAATRAALARHRPPPDAVAGPGFPPNVRSGYISWVDLQSRYHAEHFLLGSALRSDYAERDPQNGYLFADRHDGGLFCYGPHLELKRGTYRLEFHGFRDRPAFITITVRGLVGGEEVILGQIALPPTPPSCDPIRLGSLVVSPETDVEGVEVLCSVGTRVVSFTLASIRIYPYSESSSMGSQSAPAAATVGL